MKTKRKPIKNKMLNCVRHNRLWRMRIIKDKKKEEKKNGDYL
jgi:hypothetical protein